MLGLALRTLIDTWLRSPTVEVLVAGVGARDSRLSSFRGAFRQIITSAPDDGEDLDCRIMGIAVGCEG